MQKTQRSAGRPSKYGFEKLEVGNRMSRGFKNSHQCEKIRSAALAHARRSGKKFTTEIQGDILVVYRQE